MKKTLRIIGFIFLGFIVALGVIYLVLNESLPEGESGPEADAMAERMMAALDKPAWDSTTTINWTFSGIHHYEWDKGEHVVRVRWDEHAVILNPKDNSGVVENGQNYSSTEVQALIQAALDYFNNDSFWLYAPFKAFDPGTERSIVTLKDGQKGLKVTYTQGGTTPGDSYVWSLDENNRPTSVKMWVSILPIGGLTFSWENYVRIGEGALIAQDHKLLGGVNIAIENLRPLSK